MKDTIKIRKLARMKDENPELFDQLLRDNLNKNPEWKRLIDSLPMEKSSATMAGRTWLDSKLISANGIEEDKLGKMSPAEKVETFLNGECIYGYTEDIIRAVGDAYGVNLPV